MTALRARLALIGLRLHAELARLGRWSERPLDPTRLVDMGPFGQRTLAAEEWLQHVLVARLAEVGRGAVVPPGSEVAVWATRAFDGDPDADTLLAILRDLDACCAPGADALLPDEAGVPPLLRAASGGLDHALASLLATGLLEPRQIPEATGDLSPLTEALLGAGAAVDARTGPVGLTASMVARAFDRRDVAAVLAAHGADPGLRDALGRDADAMGALAVAARLARILPRSPSVHAAWFARLHLPVSHQLTTPVVALELTGPLAPETFAGWPPDQPITVMAMGEDAVSRLLRLGPPIYRREEPLDCVAMAQAIAHALSTARGQPWTVAVPGTDPPKEAWVHGPPGAPARVGCFPGRVVVWVGSDPFETPVATRSELQAALPAVSDQVERQLAWLRLEASLGGRIATASQELAARLGGFVAAPGRGGWKVEAHGDRAFVVYTFKGVVHPVVGLWSEGGRVVVRAGLYGRDGYEGPLTSVDASLPAIADAVGRSLSRLTLERLVEGASYRVREPFAGLARGAVVTFLGLDALDNHYGVYRFRGADGAETQVETDPSSGLDHRGDPLRETHRWLEAVDGDVGPTSGRKPADVP